MDTTLVRWDGCYDESWRDLIVPEAFAHPAKMSRALVARIFDELFAMGALKRGDCVVDPFGGIGTTGIEGASRGVQVVCCELEPKFVALAEQNFALHSRDWEHMRRPLPKIVQGDSRKLREHVGPVLAACVVTSPPYVSGGHHPDQTGAWNNNGGGQAQGRDVAGYGQQAGQLGQMREGAIDAVISSPPYEEIASGSGGLNTLPPKHEGQQGGRSASSASQDTDSRYGTTDGQLARLPKGEVEAIVSSPPYATDTVNDRHGVDLAKQYETYRASGGGASFESFRATQERHVGGYGNSAGQLSRMSAGAVDAVVSSPAFTHGDPGGGGINKTGLTTGKHATGKVSQVHLRTYQAAAAERVDGNLETLKLGDVADAVVSSPPYEGSLADGGDVGIKWEKARRETTGGGEHQAPGGSVHARYPGDTDGQIGNSTGETFWSAAKQIVEESFAILKPGGHAVWVVKGFVRDKQLVDFPGDWRKLCEHVGFETVTEVHAMLVHEERKPDLFGGERVIKRARKSFFRRLAESKGSPPVDWEVVWFMRKPL